MPELPEVEVTRLGISPLIVGRAIENIIVRNKKLRWPVSSLLKKKLPGNRIHKLGRRGKYLFVYVDNGCLIIHLGMSGSLKIVDRRNPPGTHDHIDILFGPDGVLRFHDPRRFGAFIWTSKEPLRHKLLRHLGPEPLGDAFNGEWLHQISRKRTQAVKNFIMDSHNVVGIGNIYANESLFMAGIHPKRKAGAQSLKRCERLAQSIREILNRSIKQGGTSLRDFTDGHGRPGYFQQQLNVYAKAGQPCPKCKAPIRSCRLNQRSTYYCTNCQR